MCNGTVFLTVSLPPHDQAKDIMCDYKPEILENSAKMVLLFHLIEESVRKGDKLLVFRLESIHSYSVIIFNQSKAFLWFYFLIWFITRTPAGSDFALCLPFAVRVCPR